LLYQPRRGASSSLEAFEGCESVITRRRGHQFGGHVPYKKMALCGTATTELPHSLRETFESVTGTSEAAPTGRRKLLVVGLNPRGRDL
jgi:hypothetical protein